ncbi:hypothetical protein QBC46DRAFT_414560 [Diplogelasinospora grovesii]|uniref:Chromo domain-containing protein n=1 Tax=Diplogelasinospora grovesii TaxID=303347 RepID=A0AAN6MW92_9PEZI|nr:hypothetical protein QBC46DRAFT_414560 [Diplogelasinospora grovesii]
MSKSSPENAAVQTVIGFEYEVKKILDSRTTRNDGIEYLIEWKSTWEPSENLRNCQQALTQFYCQHPDRLGSCTPSGNQERSGHHTFTRTKPKRHRQKARPLSQKTQNELADG